MRVTGDFARRLSGVVGLVGALAVLVALCGVVVVLASTVRQPAPRLRIG